MTILAVYCISFDLFECPKSVGCDSSPVQNEFIIDDGSKRLGAGLRNPIQKRA
jgi:hypothetical protein